MQRKALVAIAFAGAMLNGSLELPAKSESNSTAESVIEQIATDTEEFPEIRAHRLLGIANTLLEGKSKADIAKFNLSPLRISHRANRFWKSSLTSWTNLAARDFRSKTGKSEQSHLAEENKILADSIIQKALVNLDNSTDNFSKITLYFVALKMYLQTGNADGMKRCQKVLNDAAKTCDHDKNQLDDNLIIGTATVLNAEANAIFPVTIPDSPLSIKSEIKLPHKIKQADFEQSEKLRLQAATILDRLGPTEHERRKAHRDLALLYSALGKNDKGNKEKRRLFELVGTDDESILYPISGICGSLVWWTSAKKSRVGTFDEPAIADERCGMG